MSCEGDHDDVADDYHRVLGAVDVHLCRDAEHRDGRHEAGEERQRHGQYSHLSSGHEELLRRLVLARSEAVEDADDE